MSDVKIVVKVRAYERGILPTKVSQLQNDKEYATMGWVEKYVRSHSSGGGGFDGGVIGEVGPAIKIDFGVIGE